MAARIFVERSDGKSLAGDRFFAGTAHAFYDVSDAPMGTVMASRPVLLAVTDDGRPAPLQREPSKPPYRVPSMDDIRALPWNGFKVASTFAGGGGSSTGYRMAGFQVVYANEFVEAARDTYAANKAPYTVLDGRDIRTVTAESILEMTGLKPGELDVLDGSPPCASFSTAGKREQAWGKVKKYSDREQRTDDLFYEFVRLLRGLQPKAFVAENVSGLVKGTAKGYFLRILAELKASGYRVECRLLDAQWLGVPQQRQRTIFVGVRDDLGRAPAYPKPLAYRYSVRDALPWILRQGDNGPFGGGAMRDATLPSPTIGASPQTGNGKFPGSLVEAAPPWYVEPEADMSRYAVGAEWDKLKPGGQSDRYFSLVRPHLDVPSPTVTAKGGDASAASVTHPTEKRKFSIAELRRVCSFPDDYKLTGTYQQQWERCGRSVPPVMMSHIAAAVRDRILVPARASGKA